MSAGAADWAPSCTAQTSTTSNAAKNAAHFSNRLNGSSALNLRPCRMGICIAHLFVYYYILRRAYYNMSLLCNQTRQGHLRERGLCSGHCLITKQQAVCATVPKTPPTITAANSDVSKRLAARCAGCADPAKRAKRWLRCDEAVAWRNIVSSGTASLASARTSACPCARWMTDSSQESSR